MIQSKNTVMSYQTPLLLLLLMTVYPLCALSAEHVLDAELVGNGLSSEQIVRLRTNKVLLGTRDFKQIFEPYIRFGAPVFITTDSVLAAYHALFEESFQRLEKQHASTLRGTVNSLLRELLRLEKPECFSRELFFAASRRAAITLGTACALLGDNEVWRNTGVQDIIAVECARAEAALQVCRTPWLSQGVDGLDYTQYKPVGFYSTDEPLRRYFRALKWLQSIPFFVSSEEDVAALFLIVLAGGKDTARFEELLRVAQERDDLFGRGDEGDVRTVLQFMRSYEAPGSGFGQEALLAYLLRADNAPHINDQIRPGPVGSQGGGELSLRIIAPARTPDGILFQQTARVTAGLPTGLYVCAALGLPYARDEVLSQSRAPGTDVVNIIDEGLAPLVQSKRFGACLYRDYLRCLEVLCGPAEAGAPSFMTTVPWKAKICNTILAGWAQMRHAAVLRAKRCTSFTGIEDVCAGFVEPVPEFFRRLARLSAASGKCFRELGGPQQDAIVTLERLRWLRERLEHAMENPSAGMRRDVDDADLYQYLHVLYSHFGDTDNSGRSSPGRFTRLNLPRAIAGLRALEEQLSRGAPPYDARLLKELQEKMPCLQSKWRALTEVSEKLEGLARTQLRGDGFSAADRNWIAHYGEMLSAIMLYEGSGMFEPRDDAPRIAEVFFDPVQGKRLHVGIGRPRELWVLYPKGGVEMLCRGAVYPYYEFAHTAVLTDSEWMRLLDSQARPALPKFLRRDLCVKKQR
jgi:hypothetical protein